MTDSIINKLTELIGPWNPITTEGALFQGVDVQWCFACIVATYSNSDITFHLT